jgi:hypothetical protein
MSATSRTSTLSRRQLLLGAAATCLPLSGMASIVYTPHELMEQYRRDVVPRLAMPADEVRLYGGIAELQLYNVGRELLAPQYLLVIDSNPYVQAAMLFWRLLPGSYELVGASPVSTSAVASNELSTAQGLFEQGQAGNVDASCARTCSRGKQRIYDFGWQRSNQGFAAPGVADLRVQVRGADRQAERRLGTPCPDGCILLPASLISFLDEYGILDDGVPGRVQRHVLPYRGRHLMLVDSEREERPEWSPAPHPVESPRTVARAGR